MIIITQVKFECIFKILELVNFIILIFEIVYFLFAFLVVQNLPTYKVIRKDVIGQALIHNHALYKRCNYASLAKIVMRKELNKEHVKKNNFS